MTLKKITSAILHPLFYANLAAMGFGALWLVTLGQWQVMGFGTIMVFLSPYILPLLMMPAGVFSNFMVRYQNNGNKSRERVMFACSLGYILAFLAAWCAFVFGRVLQGVAPHAEMAGLVWAASLTIGPLLWWVGKDTNNVFMISMVEVAQLAVLALVVLRVVTEETAFDVFFAVVSAFLLAATLAQLLYDEVTTRKGKSGGAR